MNKQGIPLEDFWEKDDGVRMDGLIRMERFIKSQGTNSAQIWSAWQDIKQLLKAAKPTNIDSSKLPSWSETAQAVGFNIWPVSDNDKLILKSGGTVYDYIVQQLRTSA